MFDKDLVLSILMQLDEALGKIVSRTTGFGARTISSGPSRSRSFMVGYSRIFRRCGRRLGAL